MDIATLNTLIGDIGFPIAAFAAMYYMCNTTIKEVKTSIDELSRSIARLLDKADKADTTTEEA